MMRAEMEKQPMLAEIEAAIRDSRWLIRTDNDGISYGGFCWPEIGKWIECPDWNNRPECGGGFHGQTAKAGGFWNGGSRLVFCEFDGEEIVLGDKSKVRRCRILQVGIPAIFSSACVGGSLDLRGLSSAEGLTLPQSVGGSLNLRGLSSAEGLTLPQSVGGVFLKRG
ncbi:MAG: hypothetical protein A3E01_03090 [Gammaproteobacteria bacterium RIFCSPHIGHO2_12_FULL_63_22]|nr:MAG: hypothetical protein A3E01_03090 [Gammaproteobacteria bacterium RIFCSPHIGHO2_12_FULL_63_22]